MKKNIKKKTDKFTKFKLSTNSINYRDTKAVTDQFNKSVRTYKRFIEVLDGGDEYLASEKLREAGTDIYACCEWALKNYLYRRYSEQCSSNEIPKHVREHYVNILSAKEASIVYLFDELKRVGDPSFVSTGINDSIITNNAAIMNNKPKHDKTIPDPQTFRFVLDEVRKVIREYVEKEADLELINDSSYGDGKEWDEILEDTSDFSSAYSYILITKRLESDNLKGLFSLKWNCIIDMDPDSDNDGLAYKYKNIMGITPKIRTLDAVNARQKFSMSQIPYWVMANGTSDIPDSVVDVKKWGTVHGTYLPILLREFHREYPKPVKAYVYPIEEEKNLRKIIEAFNDVYDGGDEVDFRVLSAQKEYTSIEEENFKISSLTINDFSNYLGRYYQDSQFMSGLIKKELPAENGNRVEIDDSFVVELGDSFETVYVDIDREDELNSEKCNRQSFYKGVQDISWYGLRENFDIILPEHKTIEEKIRLDLKERGRLLRKVYYTPGIGGTTLMRRLAWEMREEYPTFILNRLNEQCGKNLQKIYTLTHSPILIFADNNQIEFDELKALQIELKKMGFAFVICYFQRKLKGDKSEHDGSCYDIVRQFGGREARQMQAKLTDVLFNDDIKATFESSIKNMSESDKLPFILSMYAFDKEFKGIKPFIANFLDRINDQTKKFLFALSLADYGNVSINPQYFLNLYEEESISEILLEENVGVAELVRVEEVSGKETIRIRHHLFGEEILRQISNGRDSKEIVFINLVEYIIGFIEDSRKNTYIINQDTLNVLRSLFITRTADVNSERPVFSTLITRLREEHRTVFEGNYDYSTDAIVRIFNKLVEVYPEEPHFTAHLARFYFYIDKNYEKGFNNINRAIELSEMDTGSVDPLLYHMKAMGYSSRIYNIHIKELKNNLREDSKYDISKIKEKIQEDAENAFKFFKLVRESNIGVAGHVSEINMCIQIATLAKDMLDDTDNFSEYLSSDNGNWALQYIDRAETLWDECKQLISDTLYEDLDGIEEKLRTLTASLKDSIEIWNKYIIESGNRNCTQARRILARSYLKMADQTKGFVEKKECYTKVVQLMEDNIAEESNHVGNIRIWFDTIRLLEVENQDQLIQDALVKLNRWINITDSVEAHYYRFILKCIQAINSSTLAEGELPKLLRELKQKAASQYNRTSTQHWLTNSGRGINALVSNNRNRKDAIPEDEMANMLYTVKGRISNNYVNDNHAYIVWKGVEVYFNPSQTKGEIGKTNIGQMVKFGLGFSYDGPRAYNSSIKILGKDEPDEVKREIEMGIAVKCEVIKNVEYYVQVRIVGFSEMGSIHVSELRSPYSADKRPEISTIIDGKVLNKSFDNARQCYVWRITMDLNNIKEEIKEETEISRIMRLKGIKTDQQE